MDMSETKNLPQTDYTPAVLDEPSRLLLRAAALIESRGLAKGTQMALDGSLCAMGAIVLAAGKVPNKDDLISGPAHEARMRLVRDPDLVAAGCTIGPALWNNVPERTQAEVIAKLRAVALAGA